MILLALVVAVAVLMLVLGFEMFLVLGVPALMVKEFFYGSLPDPVLVQKIVGHTSQFYLIGSVEPATEIAFPRAFKSGGAFYQGYPNQEVAGLIDRGNKTLDRAQREQLFQQANRQIQQDAPWLFLYEQQDTYGLRSRLQGFEARPDPYIIVRDWSLTS